jgi:uncharacterized membrane protein YcaP (DUF421 family)
MFFSDWFGPFRVVIVGVLAYAALIFFIRVSGKRTMSKWNAFDAVITIAFGSTFATLILAKSTALFEGLTALALLIVLQYVISWSSVRSKMVAHLVKSEPSLLLCDGKMLEDELRKKRVTRSEVKAAVRMAGHGSLSKIRAVVLETDGSFSVIPDSAARDGSALDDVRSTTDGKNRKE